MAAPEMTYGAKTSERTTPRPTSCWSRTMAMASPRAMEPSTVATVKTTVLPTTVQVSGRVNHST